MKRNVFKMMLTLSLLIAGVGGANATKTFATYGTPASNGTWNAETRTYSWTASSSNLMTIFEFPNGELADYQSIHLTTSDYTNAYRICLMNGSTAVATIAFYSAGQKDINFADRDNTKDLDLSQITHISFGGASGSGSIVLSKAYIEKPTEFKFNAAGKAFLYPSDLSATSWGLDSYDDETGTVVKSTTGYGGISFDFGTEGYSFSDITNIEISIDGEKDDIRSYSNVTDLNGHTQYISATGGSYSLGNNIDSNIKTWNLGLNDKTGTMQINYICFTSNVMKVRSGYEKPINELTSYQKDGENYVVATSYTPAYRINESTNAAYFGVDWNGQNLNFYTDLTGYSSIRVYQSTSSPTVRCFFFNSDASGQQQFNFTWNNSGYYELDLSSVQSSVGNLKLISIRPQQGVTSSVNDMTVVQNHATYDYVISGSGIAPASLTTALADATATSIDATGITKATALATANPNCMIVANEGMVTNANNVIVSGTCASLALTDGKPFKAPADFTATAATFTTTINTTAKAGTLCLPYATTIPDGVKAYTLTYTSGDKVTGTEITSGTIPANTPVLLNGSGEVTFNGSGAVDADATNVSGALTGVFQSAYVPQNSYVLQNGTNAIGFYKVDADNKISATPFRAYLTAAADARSLSIQFDDVTTGIESISSLQSQTSVLYDLQGRRVVQPKSGIYVKNGKKVIVK